MKSYAYENFNHNSSRNLDLDLYYCGTESCAPGHAFGPGYKDHHKIHYIHEGRGTFSMLGQTWELGPRQAFLIYPDMLAHYEADLENPWRYSWVAFDGLNSVAYLDRIGFRQRSPVITCNNPQAIERDMTELLRCSESDMNRDLRLIGQLYIFLSTLIADREPAQRPGEVNDYIDKAIRYIEKNYTQDLRVEQVAEYVCLERKYFSKLFKQQTGLSPKEFLINYRMRKARALMENADIPIGQVSASVGYKDPLLFSRVFKARNGCSPKSFRASTRPAPARGKARGNGPRNVYYDPPRIPYPRSAVD